MRQVAKKGLLTVVATSGVLAVTGGLAYADSNAQGVAAGSPGVLSGNTIQVPVHVPVNACGNTINIVGALNPAAGNTCVNGGGDHHVRGHRNGFGHRSERGNDAAGSAATTAAPATGPSAAAGTTTATTARAATVTVRTTAVSATTVRATTASVTAAAAPTRRPSRRAHRASARATSSRCPLTFRSTPAATR